MMAIIFPNSALAISLNDSLNYNNFATYFNEHKESRNAGIRLQKHDTEFEPSKKLYITPYTSNKGCLLILQSKPSGELHELDIWVDTSSIGYDAAMEVLLTQALIAERVLGMPGGEGASDGMFALIDAMKKGQGTYWSNETNRKYVVVPLKNGKNIGYMIFAEI